MIKAADETPAVPTPGVPVGAPYYGQAHNMFRAETLKRLGMFGISAFGAGAAIRGIKGLGDLWSGTTGPPMRVPLRQQFVDVPVHRRKQAQTGVPATPPTVAPVPAPAAPAATGPLTSFGGKALDWSGRLLDSVGAMQHPGDTWGPTSLQNLILNPSAQHMGNMGWTIPAGLAAVGGGLYAGHQLTDTVLDKAKGHETDSELEEAQRDYERALAGKSASHDSLAGLDQLYDQLEKAGAFQKRAAWEDQVSPALGTYATAAGLTSLIAGLGTYKYMRDAAEDKTIDDALKQRSERLFASQPPTIHAVPREVDFGEDDPTGPVPLPHIPSARSLRHLVHDKAANLGLAATGFMQRIRTQDQQRIAAMRKAFGIEEKPVEPDTAAAQPAGNLLPSVIPAGSLHPAPAPG